MAKDFLSRATIIAALLSSAELANADCAGTADYYNKAAQLLARDLPDYQQCVAHSRGLRSCSEEFGRVRGGQLRFEQAGFAYRQCADAPEGLIERVKFSWLQTDAEIGVAESRIRDLLPWDIGESRLWLWASAFALFMLSGSLLAALMAAAGRRLCELYVTHHRLGLTKKAQEGRSRQEQ
jgi:hypothetical protein